MGGAMKSAKFVFATVAIFLSFAPSAGDAPDDLKEFIRSGKAARIMCTQAFKASNERGLECGADHKQRVAKAYAAASKSLAKNKKASAALKEYYVSWLGYFKGLEPALSERQISYDQRQATNEDSLNQLEARIEIELN